MRKNSLCKVERNTQQTGATSAFIMTAKGYAQYHGIPFATAKGIAPLSSEMGRKDRNAVHKKVILISKIPNQ
jgi:hypothetical protein